VWLPPRPWIVVRALLPCRADPHRDEAARLHVSGWVRDWITDGENLTCEITSRFGSETAVIEIAPPTPTGVGFVPAVTTAVRSDVAFVESTRFFAVTPTRIVLSSSAARTPYVLPVAPAMSLQFEPSLSHVCHWYE
jgi:hypothetical protein